MATEPTKPSVTEAKSEIKAMLEKADQIERTTGRSGAVPLAPKGMLLDARDVQEKFPDKKVRWCSTANKEKMELRQASGYRRIPDVEGGRQVGNLVLMELPREEHDRRVKANEKQNKDRLTQHNREAEQMADNVAKELRDRYGVTISAEKLLVKDRE